MKNTLAIWRDGSWQVSEKTQLGDLLNIPVADILLSISDEIQIGKCVLSQNNATLTNTETDQWTHLTEKQVGVLAYLVSFVGSKVSREDLKRNFWIHENSDNALNRFMFGLRDKLASIDSGIIIKTAYGSGFLLTTKGEQVL